MNIFNLTAQLTLDKNEYTKGINQAKQEGKSFSEATEKAIGIIAKASWLELAQAVINAGKKVAQVTLDLIDYADRYSDLSAKYDISTKSLQEFEYIASQNGATLDGVVSTMTMMYNRAKENDEVFGKLGVSVRDTNGNMKTMDTLFWEVKEALDNVDNSGDKSALMLEAFGRNAMSLGEILRKDTGELKDLAQKANDLGIILNEETIDSASSFNDKLDEMKLRGKTALTEFLAGAEGSEEQLDQFIDDLLDEIDGKLPQFVRFAMKMMGRILISLAQAVPDMIPVLVDSFFAVNWYEVGWELAKGIGKGLWEGLKAIGGLIVGKGWLWGNEGSLIPQKSTNIAVEEPLKDIDIVDTNGYEITERQSKSVEIKLTADGTSAIDEKNAELIAEKLIPIIDKGLGGI